VPVTLILYENANNWRIEVMIKSQQTQLLTS